MTATEAAFLRAVADLTVDGVTPSYDELRRHLGYASKSNIHRLVEQLVAKGMLTHARTGHRSLRLVPDVAERVAREVQADLAIDGVTVDVRRVQAAVARGLVT